MQVRAGNRQNPNTGKRPNVLRSGYGVLVQIIVESFNRITAFGDRRVTASGDTRITAGTV